jgi:hypothetical protein
VTISVLIAAQGECSRLGATLAGLVQQTHPDWDVAIIDAGAAVNVASLVAAQVGVAPRARLATMPAGARTAALRNRLLALATGEAAVFLEPADRWHPRHLEESVRVLAAGADFAVSDLHRAPTADAPGASRTSMPAELETHAVRLLFSRNALPTPSCVVFKREAAAAVGEFDPRFVVAEPRDFWFRCALAGGRFRRTGADTCTRTRDNAGPLLAAADMTLFYDKYHDLPSVPAALRRRLLVSSLITEGRLLRSGDPAAAARCFSRAWSLQPMHVQTLGQFALTRWMVDPPARGAPVDVPERGRRSERTDRVDGGDQLPRRERLSQECPPAARRPRNRKSGARGRAVRWRSRRAPA